MLGESGEARLLPKAAAAIRTQIKLHGGNEVCFVCTLDEDGHLATARKVAAGDVQSVLALPGVAERGEVLVHNHPSGDPTPSQADIAMTQHILDACQALGLTLHDHLVIGREREVSFRAQGLL